MRRAGQKSTWQAIAVQAMRWILGLLLLILTGALVVVGIGLARDWAAFADARSTVTSVQPDGGTVTAVAGAGQTLMVPAGVSPISVDDCQVLTTPDGAQGSLYRMPNTPITINGTDYVQFTSTSTPVPGDYTIQCETSEELFTAPDPQLVFTNDQRFLLLAAPFLTAVDLALIATLVAATCGQGRARRRERVREQRVRGPWG